MSTSAVIPVRWSDIQAMPRGEARERLEHAYRQRRASIRRTYALDRAHAEQVLVDAEVHRVRALDRYGDTPEDQAARLTTLNRDADIVGDPRGRRHRKVAA